MRPGIFLDRDGVINANRPDHVTSWAEFEFLPGALSALRHLTQLGWPIAVITNQSIIGRGLATQETVEAINARMISAVQAAGGRMDGVWYCPHAPEAGCACRKPAPGLLFAAAKDLRLDLAHSFLVGDALSDIQAAHAAGVYPIMVRTGRGVAQLQSAMVSNLGEFAIVDDLQAAVDWIYDVIIQKVSQPTTGTQ